MVNTVFFHKIVRGAHLQVKSLEWGAYKKLNFIGALIWFVHVQYWNKKKLFYYLKYWFYYKQPHKMESK